MFPHRRTALLVLLSLLLLGSSLTGSASASGGSDLHSARQQMAAMQAKVDAVAARLATGTRAYERAQRHLSDVQRQERSARRRAAQLDASLSTEQRRLDAMANAAYRRPVPATLAMTMAGGGDGLARALVAQADLDHVAGSQQEVLRTVVRQRLRARALLRTAEQLSADAARTQRTVSRQLRDLRAIADRANRELQAAAASLAKAQAAERARRAALRVSRSRFVIGGGATCSGGSTSGYANGFLPASALCPLWQAPGHRLRADAAAAFNRMSQLHASSAGGPLCVTDS